jgi:hypothetical protein
MKGVKNNSIKDMQVHELLEVSNGSLLVSTYNQIKSLSMSLVWDNGNKAHNSEN